MGFEKPSDRILIKIAQQKTLRQLRLLQNKSEPESCLTIHFYLRAYLLMTSLLSGLFGGMTTTMFKLFLGLVSNSSFSDLVASPIAWITFVCALTMLFSNLYNLNVTISLYSQLLVMPTYECCIIFGTMMSGGVVMHEFVYYEQRQLVTIFVGICIALIGIMYKVCMLEVDGKGSQVTILGKIDEDNLMMLRDNATNDSSQGRLDLDDNYYRGEDTESCLS